MRSSPRDHHHQSGGGGGHRDMRGAPNLLPATSDQRDSRRDYRQESDRQARHGRSGDQQYFAASDKDSSRDYYRASNRNADDREGRREYDRSQRRDDEQSYRSRAGDDRDWRDQRHRRSRSRDRDRRHSPDRRDRDRGSEKYSQRDYGQKRHDNYERQRDDSKVMTMGESSSSQQLDLRRNASDKNFGQQPQMGAEDSSKKVPTVVSGAGQGGATGKQARQDVRVRELWVGNLPEGITKEVIYSHFFIFGEIEAIELNRQHKSYPYYAFIRFKLTNCTKRAFDQAQNIEINGAKIKVQFSDYNKRPASIVGDCPDYDLTPANCCTLFVAFSVNSQLPSQALIEQIFCKYGKVRAIWMKQTEANTQYRPHFFVDYSTPQEAHKARQDIYDNDRLGTKRALLGDKSCEVLLAIRKRNKQNSDPNAAYLQSQHTQFQQQHTIFQQPQLQYQPSASFNFQQQQQQSAEGAKPQEIHPLVKSLLEMPQLVTMRQQNPEVANKLISSIMNDPTPARAQSVIASLIEAQRQQMQQVPQQQPPQQVVSPLVTTPTHNLNQQLTEQQQSTNSILDLIKKSKEQNNTKSSQQEEPRQAYYKEQAAKKPAFQSIFEDDDRNVWSGFVTRSRQHKVLMEAYLVGECPDNTQIHQFLSDQDHNLNVSHRTNYEDVDKHPVQGVVAFIPQNTTQEKQFREYIDYFVEKKRVGLCFLRNGVMFLVPPGETALKYFPEGERSERAFMVGVFGDQQASVAQQARFAANNINSSMAGAGAALGHNNNNVNK